MQLFTISRAADRSSKISLTELQLWLGLGLLSQGGDRREVLSHFSEKVEKGIRGGRNCYSTLPLMKGLTMEDDVPLNWGD